MKIQRIAAGLLAASLALATDRGWADTAPAGGPLPVPRSGGPVTARLTWERTSGAEDCMTQEVLAQAVNRRWGREVLRQVGPTELALTGTIGPRSGGRWAALLEMRRADGSSLGSREIATQAKDCSALDDAVALAAGLMLDM